MIIKVGDLLRDAGNTDIVVFEDLHLQAIENLTPKGISGELHLQSLSKNDIEAVFYDIKASVMDVSDISLESFERSVVIGKYIVRYSTNVQEDDGEVFPINAKSLSLSISEPLQQAFILQRPFICKMEHE